MHILFIPCQVTILMYNKLWRLDSRKIFNISCINNFNWFNQKIEESVLQIFHSYYEQSKHLKCILATPWTQHLPHMPGVHYKIIQKQFEAILSFKAGKNIISISMWIMWIPNDHSQSNMCLIQMLWIHTLHANNVFFLINRDYS